MAAVRETPIPEVWFLPTRLRHRRCLTCPLLERAAYDTFSSRGHDRSKDVEVMQTIGLTALIAIGLGTSALADETVPEEYQGVWAAARDCKANFQNVLSTVVNRELAACRIMQVLSSGHPESH